MQHLQKTRGGGTLNSPPALLCLPSSVHSSKFRIPQFLYLPLLRKHRGWGGFFPFRNVATRGGCVSTQSERVPSAWVWWASAKNFWFEGSGVSEVAHDLRAPEGHCRSRRRKSQGASLNS